MKPWNGSYLELIWFTPRRKPTRLTPVTEDMGGQSGIKGRCSFNLDRSARTMKRYKKKKNMKVCHMCVKYMS